MATLARRTTAPALTGGLTAAALAVVAGHGGVESLVPLVSNRPRPIVEAEVSAAVHRLRAAVRDGHVSPGDQERATVLLELLVELAPPPPEPPDQTTS